MTTYTLPLSSNTIDLLANTAGYNVTSTGVNLPGGITLTTNLSDPLPFDYYDSLAADAYNIAASSYNQANTATNLAQTVYTYANTISGGAAIDNVARVLASSASSNTIILQGVNTTQNTTISLAYDRANTSINTVFGTSGSVTTSNGRIIFKSTNGVTVVGSDTSLTINTPQALRTSDSPTFASLSLTSPLALSQGGTGATSSSSALTALLPTGTTAGYVLTTGGPGTYYWAPGGSGGGGGATPGTTISSTRLTYTANGTGFSYTTPTYTPGSSQLRIYFDGVRQFTSEYTETSNTIVTFSSSPPSGTAILVEVDGFIDNPYYANNITFTAPFGSIDSSANTIQLAIQDLETRKAALAGPSFTGTVTAPTPAISTGNTQVATTSYVNTLANSSITFTHNITGTASALITTGSYQIGSLGVGTPASGTAGEIRATNEVTAYYSSDERLKENIQVIDAALYKLKKVHGVMFDWTDEVIEQRGGEDNYFVRKRDTGLIAQEVEQVLPEVVAIRKDGYKAIRYEKMTGLIIQAINELADEVEEIKKRLK